MSTPSTGFRASKVASRFIFFAARPSGARPTTYAQDPGYGADVLAVSDAIVIALRDSVADPDGQTDKPSPRVEDGAGNYIVLRLRDGRFAIYEHLRRGVRVKIGDRVRLGDTIAALGATGHVSGPHLHFHLSDASDALRGEGLAYRFAHFREVGRYASIADFDAGLPYAKAGIAIRREKFPAPNAVVRFDGTANCGGSLLTEPMRPTSLKAARDRSSPKVAP